MRKLSSRTFLFVVVALVIIFVVSLLVVMPLAAKPNPTKAEEGLLEALISIMQFGPFVLGFSLIGWAAFKFPR